MNGSRPTRGRLQARSTPGSPAPVAQERISPGWAAALALLVFAALPARAQNVPTISPQTAGALVTGRVVCADTQRAARFAQISLIPAADDEEEGGGRGRRLSARTDLDGNFSIPGVPQGDYFVTGQLAGYVNEAPILQAALNGDSASAAIPAGVPKIRVGSGGASTPLSLQRGAVVAGSVQWDDGSPAAGVGVSVTPAPSTAGSTAAPSTAAQTGAGFGGFGGGGFGGGGFGGAQIGAQTDDRGHFRLSGLAPGAYLVRATVQAPAPATAVAEGRGFARTLSLSVYAPDKLRRTDATPLTLAPGEERDDLNITMNLAALHSVAGSVGSSSAPVRSGSISLTDQTDSTLIRTGTLNPDGTFVVPYVPAGNYTLRANASSLAPSYGRGGQAPASNAATVRFQPLQESITVTGGDLTGLSLTVTPATPASNSP